MLAEPESQARAAARPDDVLLEIEDLSVEFRVGSHRAASWVRVVDAMQLSVKKGQTVGIVGESGSGKTVTALSIMGLLPVGMTRMPTGSIRFGGREILGLSNAELNELRGRDVGMIFQEPRRSLNPAFTVGDQIAEVLRRHSGASRREARARAIEMLDTVGIPDASRRARSYPYEFSGGMCQRVMLAVALVNHPKLLIADEPTTALDVTVQARMLELMRSLQADLDLSIVFISHDLRVVAEMCDHVAVMYAGELVEQASVSELYTAPKHPYSQGLLSSIPDARSRSFSSIGGTVPSVTALPPGCRFGPRCAHAQAGRCDTDPIALVQLSAGHQSRCVRATELELPGAVR